MAFQKIDNVEIVGLAACVPADTVENSELDVFENETEYRKFVEFTGVERRHITKIGVNCASDFCLHSAEQLIEELNWNKEEIDCLVFVSHSPDYKYPATACILQSKLGLSQECMSFDVSLGCSGWVYGLSIIASIISSGKIEKALLLSGDTASFSKSRKDKGTYPLFGDSGSATALIYKEGADGIVTHLGTNVKNHKAIIIEDGGGRNPVTSESLIEREYEQGIFRNRLQTHMDGMSVFSFGISTAPKSVNALLNKFQIDKNAIDYFVFHQANLKMNQIIQKKLSIPDEKVPYVLKDYGNTSSGSIPLAMVVQLNDEINNSNLKKLNMIACGFGVGLSWGSAYFSLHSAICCDLIEI